MRENKWRNRSVGQQECVGDKIDMLARDRAGTGNRGNVHDCRGTATPEEITLFVLPNLIQVKSVDKAIGLTVELYTL